MREIVLKPEAYAALMRANGFVPLAFNHWIKRDKMKLKDKEGIGG